MGPLPGFHMRAAGEGSHQETLRRVAAGEGQMRERQLHLAADADRILLGRRGGGGAGQGSDGLRNRHQRGPAVVDSCTVITLVPSAWPESRNTGLATMVKPAL